MKVLRQCDREDRACAHLVRRREFQLPAVARCGSDLRDESQRSIQLLHIVTDMCSDISLWYANPSLLIPQNFLQTLSLYKAKAMTPTTAAASPNSSLPAAPVDSAGPPVDVPVAAAPEPEGLGAEPVAVTRVPLLELSALREPVPEAEAEAPVPLGLTLPVEVGTAVAGVVLAFVRFVLDIPSSL